MVCSQKCLIRIGKLNLLLDSMGTRSELSENPNPTKRPPLLIIHVHVRYLSVK